MTQATIELKLFSGGRRQTKPQPQQQRKVTPFWMSRTLWCLAAIAFLVLREFAGDTSRLMLAYGDTDDATRLVQVRELLAGAGWYDLVLSRFGGPTPLVSHWSRLIDVPLAALLLFFGMFMSAANAELAMRAVWPMLLLFLLLRVLTAEADKRGGTRAAALALGFAITTLSALYQFRLGRIDHHNAMILCTIAGLLLFTRAIERPSLGYAAGACMGVALVIGYEPLGLVLPLAILAALVSVVYQPLLLPTRNFAIALTAALAVGLLTASPPWLWHVVVCDAISANLVLLAGFSALGLTIMQAFSRKWGLVPRFLTLVVTGAVAGVAYLAVNPVCIGGPFANISVEARQLWLGSVAEAQAAWQLNRDELLPVLVFLVSAVAGIAAAFERHRRLRTSETAMLLVMTGFSVLPVLFAMKFLPYASFVAAFCIALSVAEFKGSPSLTPVSMRLAGLILLNQWTIVLVVSPVFAMISSSAAKQATAPVSPMDACSDMASVRPLGKLAQGLVVAPIDLGPVIVAETHHDVLAAPYHRIDTAIVETQKIFRAAPREAEQRLRTVKASYLVACIPTGQSTKELSGLGDGVTDESLVGHLTRGKSVPFLTEVKSISPQPALRLWLINPE